MRESLKSNRSRNLSIVYHIDLVVRIKKFNFFEANKYST